MKRTNLDLAAIATNKELRELFEDAIGTIRQARKLEGQLYGSRVYNNQTASIEAKVDAVYTKARIDMLYDIARYDCIEAINAEVGGNVVDMTGTDKQVCRRFYEAYGKIA